RVNAGQAANGTHQKAVGARIILCPAGGSILPIRAAAHASKSRMRMRREHQAAEDKLAGDFPVSRQLDDVVRLEALVFAEGHLGRYDSGCRHRHGRNYEGPHIAQRSILLLKQPSISAPEYLTRRTHSRVREQISNSR